MSYCHDKDAGIRDEPREKKPYEYTEPTKPCECGNKTRYIGHDYHGYPGEDCSCGAYHDGDHDGECICAVHLTQPFVVDAETRELLDYECHSGGYDANIHEYQEVTCAACGALVWKEDSTGRPPAKEVA